MTSRATRSPPSLARARSLAGGKLLDELAVMEADATAFSSMPEAERLIGALLERSPSCVAAWELKSALARGQGDFARAEAILVEAAAATKDPELMDATRTIQAKHGALVPFEGLVPGAVSAGALAKELLRATKPETDAYPLASAHRAALGPQSRLAFDGAALAIAAHFGTFEMAEARLHALVPAWRGASHELARLIGVALHLGLGDSLPLLAYEIGEDVPAARAILDALAVAGEGKLLGRVLRAAEPDASPARAALTEGLHLLKAQLEATLHDLGVEVDRRTGEPVDAEGQRVVEVRAAGPNERVGTVVEVVRPGYALGAKIVREAEVVAWPTRTSSKASARIWPRTRSFRETPSFRWSARRPSTRSRSIRRRPSCPSCKASARACPAIPSSASCASSRCRPDLPAGRWRSRFGSISRACSTSARCTCPPASAPTCTSPRAPTA